MTWMIPSGDRIVLRFGFNGKENDNEVKGTGNSLDFEARIYDPRLGRWLSLDPETRLMPWISPYNYVSNSPILKIDPDGKVDYTYTLRDVKNKDGSLTRIVDINVVYKVVNQSSRAVTQAHFAGAQNEAVGLFNYSVPEDAKYLKNVSNIIVNVNISFKMENDINNVKAGENILLVVDKLKNQEGEKDVAGLAYISGNVAAVEASYLNDGNFPALVLHEVGHNFNLEHNNGSGSLMNDHLENSGTGRGGFNLTKNEIKTQFEGAYLNSLKSENGTHCDGDVKSNAKKFRNEYVTK